MAAPLCGRHERAQHAATSRSSDINGTGMQTRSFSESAWHWAGVVKKTLNKANLRVVLSVRLREAGRAGSVLDIDRIGRLEA